MIWLLYVLQINLDYCLFDYNGIIGTGQSLSVGYGSQDPASYFSSQPFNNLRLSLGKKELSWPIDPHDPEISLVPLTEPFRKTQPTFDKNCGYPKNVKGESPHSAMAAQISSLAENVVTVHSLIGEGNQNMRGLGKGAQEYACGKGRAYKSTIFEVKAITNLVRNKAEGNKTYGVNAVILTHGERDQNRQARHYTREMLSLQKDYFDDISAITGQSERIVFLISQMNSSPNVLGGGIASSTMAQWAVQGMAPGSVILACPKYQLPYFQDTIHLNLAGYDILGEKYGEIYNEVVVKGNRNWKPLQPLSTHRLYNDTVKVTFHVPNPPLQWDTSLPNPAAKVQWRLGNGFELSSGQTPLGISDVVIADTSVLIIASEPLPSKTLKVGYAATGQAPRQGGTWRWGLLKDSDPTVGYRSKEVLSNWAIAFEMDVGY